MKKISIEQHIEATMNSLDGAGRATPAPFLLTRINAGLLKNDADQNFWSRAFGLISKPQIAFAGILLVAMINIAIIAISNTKKGKSVAEQTVTDNRDEFALNVTSIYDVENQEP